MNMKYEMDKIKLLGKLAEVEDKVDELSKSDETAANMLIEATDLIRQYLESDTGIPTVAPTLGGLAILIAGLDRLFD